MHSLPTLSGLLLGSQLSFPHHSHTACKILSPCQDADFAGSLSPRVTGRKKPSPCEPPTPWMRALPLVVTPFAPFVFQD